MAETTLEAAARSLGARTDPVLELFDYLKDVLFWIKDKKGIFRWVNTTLLLHIGRSSRDQIIGRTDFDLFEPYLANQYQMDDAQVLRGRPITSRVEMIVFNHTPRWIVTSKLPVRNSSGRIVGSAGVATMAAQDASKIWTESRLAPAMAFIKEHYHEPVSIPAMAQTCGLSLGSFHHSTNYTVDGVYVRSLRFNNLSLAPPIDAVQEVTVLRNSFSTEYGQGHAVVSIVTKSGTNRFTGSMSEFFRSDTFDKKNYFAATKPELKRNQFGGTSGGPLQRDRIFVFGSYEGLRTTKGLPFLAAVPDPVLLTGDFSRLSTPIIDPLTRQPFPGNIVPASRFSKFARTLAPTIPTPNAAGANNYNINKNFTDDADTVTIRSDQVLNTRHNLFERFMWYDGSQLNPSVFSYTNLPQEGRNLAIGETWVMSSSLVNETRFGYNYAYHVTSPISLDGRNWVGDIGLRNLAGGTDPIDYGRPGFTISGFTGNGEGGITQGATEKIFSVSNATSWVKGRHSIRFGIQAQYRRFQHLTEVPPRGGFTFNGLFSGNATADFLLGYCSICTGAFGNSRSNYTSPTISPEFPAPFSIDPNNRTAYIVQWNVNLQRSFGSNYLLEVAYTGSESRNEHKRFNINQARPGTAPIQTRVPYPAFQSAILYSSDAGHADFRAISFRLEKRYAAGLWLNANYQLARNRDIGSGEIEANDTAFAWDLDADYGYSRYDQRHRSAFSVGYELPFGEGKRWLSGGGAAAAVLGGWGVQGIVTASSGFPFTVSSTNVCQCGNFVPNRVNLVSPGNFGALDNPTPTRWFDKAAYSVAPAGTQGTAGRNTLRGPGTQLVNFSVIKRFPVGHARMELRGEIFNLLNHANFAPPDGNISNVTAGVISTAGDGRNTQLGLRVSW